MARGEKTVLIRANDKSYSLRTTVPTGIVKQLDLNEGDSILWKLVPNGKDFMIVIEPFYNDKPAISDKNKKVKNSSVKHEK